jgi:predicted Zn finger-like uncharacterized protein
MALFFTQCPHCQTTFRTSVSQLQSADGMVRCGACLKVFVADDNLLPSADLQTMDIPMSAEPEEQEEPEERDEREPSSSVIPEVPEPIFTLETEAPGPQDIEPTFSEPGPHWEFVDDTAASEQLDEPAVEPAVEPDAEPDASAEPEIAAAAPVETSQFTSAQPGETSATPPPLRSFSALDDDFTMLREPAMAADGPAMKSEHLETLARAGDALEFDWLASPSSKPRSAWWGISAFLLVARAVRAVGVLAVVRTGVKIRRCDHGWCVLAKPFPAAWRPWLTCSLCAATVLWSAAMQKLRTL